MQWDCVTPSSGVEVLVGLVVLHVEEYPLTGSHANQQGVGRVLPHVESIDAKCSCDLPTVAPTLLLEKGS